MSHTIKQLGKLGQSVWYDFITRDLVRSGELERLIREEGLKGMTSNPTIFQKAVAGSSDYDDDIRRLSAEGARTAEIVESLMTADVRSACDVFRPVYDASNEGDGTVSIEVPPDLAYDTDATIKAAHRLWERVDRPNLMVKIPGTVPGLAAITRCLADGLNINITLLFSVERYKHVIEAFVTAIEARLSKNRSIDRIFSVASFFVSRVDGQTDPKIEKIGDAGSHLLHRMAIANARNAYATFEASQRTPRWSELSGRGARPQRPLWASTSTKDPSLSDIYYVEALVSPQTVNTIPPKTFNAYLDHGHPEVRVTADTEAEAVQLLGDYERLGAGSLSDVTAFLEKEGVKKFSDSWQELLREVDQKARTLAA
jgi:transaldolase